MSMTKEELEYWNWLLDDEDFQWVKVDYDIALEQDSNIDISYEIERDSNDS